MTEINLEGIMLYETSQTKIPHFHIYVEPKNKTNEQTFVNTEN